MKIIRPYYRHYHFRKFPHKSKSYMHNKVAMNMFWRTQKYQPIIATWSSRKRYVYPVNELLSIRRTIGLDQWFRFYDYTQWHKDFPYKWPWQVWRPKTRALYLKQGRFN